MELQIITWSAGGLIALFMLLLQRSYRARDTFEKRIKEDIENINIKIIEIEKSIIRLEMTLKNMRQDGCEMHNKKNNS